jgi:hypothetical protein
MKLPGADVAIVDVEKLTGYCLNPEHPRGKHKARVFADAPQTSTSSRARLTASAIATC